MSDLSDADFIEAPAALASAVPAPRSLPAIVPLLLPMLAIGLYLGFQAEQAMTERQQLQAQLAAQEAPLASARRVRAAADALAADTQKMASDGNLDAQHIVEQLRRHGVVIQPGKLAAPSH